MSAVERDCRAFDTWADVLGEPVIKDDRAKRFGYRIISTPLRRLAPFIVVSSHCFSPYLSVDHFVSSLVSRKSLSLYSTEEPRVLQSGELN